MLAHIIGFSYEAILAEFEGQASRGMQDRAAEAGSGDVKYHVGARELVRSRMGELEISLAPNPVFSNARRRKKRGGSPKLPATKTRAA